MDLIQFILAWILSSFLPPISLLVSSSCLYCSFGVLLGVFRWLLGVCSLDSSYPRSFSSSSVFHFSFLCIRLDTELFMGCFAGTDLGVSSRQKAKAEGKQSSLAR